MMSTIYIDQYLLINFLCNFLILQLTRKVMREKSSNPRVFLSSVIGAVYAVCIFIPQTAFLCSWLGKLLFSMLLVGITYKIHTLKRYLRTLCVFYIVSFIMGGCGYAIAAWCTPGGSAHLLKILLTTTMLSYFVITYFSSWQLAYAL